MTKAQHLKHFLFTLSLTLAPIALLVLTSSPWAHAAWAVPVAGLINWWINTKGGTVPPAAALVLLAAVGLLNGCAHSSPPVTAFGHCTTQALETAAEGILGRVTSALATGDYIDQFAALANEVGAAEVGCAVDLVIAEFSQKALRVQDSQTALVLQHAQAWRLANP